MREYQELVISTNDYRNSEGDLHVNWDDYQMHEIMNTIQLTQLIDNCLRN